MKVIDGAIFEIERNLVLVGGGVVGVGVGDVFVFTAVVVRVVVVLS